MTSRFWLHLRANSTGSYTWSRCGAYAEPKEVHHGSCEKWSACEWKLEMIYLMRWPGYQAFRKGSSSSSQAWLRVLCRRINWPWSSHPKSTSKEYQSFGQKVVALLMFGYLLWTQQWVMINIEEIDRTRQDCYWGWGKVSLWLKCDILPTNKRRGKRLTFGRDVILCNED